MQCIDHESIDKVVSKREIRHNSHHHMAPVNSTILFAPHPDVADRVQSCNLESSFVPTCSAWK